MTWQVVETVTPLSNNWIYTQGITQSELFRISYLNLEIDSYYPKYYICQVLNKLSSPDLYQIRKQYAGEQKLIIEMRIPQEFKTAGLVARYIGVKRGQIYSSPNLQLVIEKWVP